MRAQAVRRLRQRQREALAEEHEAVEEAARQLDVVVEDQQPVVPLRRMLDQQPVEVLELAEHARGCDVQLDIVA